MYESGCPAKASGMLLGTNKASHSSGLFLVHRLSPEQHLSVSKNCRRKNSTGSSNPPLPPYSLKLFISLNLNTRSRAFRAISASSFHQRISPATGMPSEKRPFL